MSDQKPKKRPEPPKPKHNPKTDKKYKAKTSRQREEEAARKKLAAAKRQMTAAQKKLKALDKTEKVVEEGESGLVTGEDLEELTPTQQDYLQDEENVVFKPNEGPQTEFLAASETEVFYGGARGGGKTYSMIVDPLRYCHNGNFRGLFLRRTMPELRDVIFKTHQLYKKAFPGAKWKEKDNTWYFPSGARIEFGYAENLQDALRYQGQSYTWIGIDEVPQYPTPDILNFLRSSLRSTDPSLPTQLRMTGNPGNVGSLWVKEEFIDAAPPNTRFYQTVTFDTPRGPQTHRISKRFIPATVYDNPYLTYDASYTAMLAQLPEEQKRQFLYGDWDVIEGAAFPEFNRGTHVVEPFELPRGWQRFRAADWGYSSPACCLWFAQDYDGNLYVYRELYVNGSASKKKYTAEDFANAINELEMGENVRYGVLDSAVWQTKGDVGGPSVAEVMNRLGNRWRPSDRSRGSRVNGKLEIHRRLKLRDTGVYEDDHYDEEGRLIEGRMIQKPSLMIFNNCRNLIRTLPMLPLDENNAEDVDTDTEDHAYDALRYGCMSRPLPAESFMDLRLGDSSQANAPADEVFGY